MRKLILLCVFIPSLLPSLLPGIALGEIYRITISSDNVKILEDIVPNVQEWLNKAAIGKINKSSKRIIRKETGDLLRLGRPIPDTKKDIINGRLNRPGYKNKAERDALREQAFQDRVNGNRNRNTP